MTKKTLTFDT